MISALMFNLLECCCPCGCQNVNRFTGCKATTVEANGLQFKHSKEVSSWLRRRRPVVVSVSSSNVGKN